MSAPSQENQVQNSEPKQNDKELNFRNLEARYQKALDQERAEREKLQQQLNERSRPQANVEDEDDDEPYVDKKRLNKTLSKFGQSTQSDIQNAMKMAKDAAKEELKQEMWLDQNPDFYEVLNHAEKFAARSPEMAKTILRMPDGFERQKLVYQTIKELGIDKPEQKQSSIQEKIDANKKAPYYQPSGVGTAPYASQGDFSTSGKENAYKKMQQLIANRRG
jgi:hypothetical protein